MFHPAVTNIKCVLLHGSEGCQSWYEKDGIFLQQILRKHFLRVLAQHVIRPRALPSKPDILYEITLITEQCAGIGILCSPISTQKYYVV